MNRREPKKKWTPNELLHPSVPVVEEFEPVFTSGTPLSTQLILKICQSHWHRALSMMQSAIVLPAPAGTSPSDQHDILRKG